MIAKNIMRLLNWVGGCFGFPRQRLKRGEHLIKSSASLTQLNLKFNDTTSDISWEEMKAELIEAGYHHRTDLAIQGHKKTA